MINSRYKFSHSLNKLINIFLSNIFVINRLRQVLKFYQAKLHQYFVEITKLFRDWFPFWIIFHGLADFDFPQTEFDFLQTEFDFLRADWLLFFYRLILIFHGLVLNFHRLILICHRLSLIFHGLILIFYTLIMIFHRLILIFL